MILKLKRLCFNFFYLLVFLKKISQSENLNWLIYIKDERVFYYSPKYLTVLESPFTFTLVKLYFAKFFIDLSHFLPLKAD